MRLKLLMIGILPSVSTADGVSLKNRNMRIGAIPLSILLVTFAGKIFYKFRVFNPGSNGGEDIELLCDVS